MLLGFKTEFKLNNQQPTALMKHCGVARHAWNWGLWFNKNILDPNKTNPNKKLKFPTALEEYKLLVVLLKSANPWDYKCSKSASQQALMPLRSAGKHCFNKTAGVSKFKKKGKQDSLTLEGTVKIFGNNKIQVPVIGVLKTYERLPQASTKSATISRQADRCFIAFRFDVERQESTSDSIVLAEIGVKNHATLSTGEVIV